MHTPHQRGSKWRSSSHGSIFAVGFVAHRFAGTRAFRILPMPTWLIDSLEEDSAQIEEDGVRVIHVPRSILPAGAKEGDVLLVGLEQQRRGKREAVRVTITLDPDATEEALEKSRKQVKRARNASRRRDSGGDIAL